MSEDSEIVINYSDIRRVTGENTASYTTTPVENWNSPTCKPTLPSNDYSASPFAGSKLSVSMFIAIGAVVTITIVVIVFFMAFMIKIVNKQEKISSKNNVATITRPSQVAGVSAQDESAFFSNDDSKSESEKTTTSAVSKFCRDVFATESGIEKNFDYQYLLWSAEEKNVQNVVDEYRKAANAISEWTKKLTEINVNSSEYQNVSSEIKTSFERYRTSATALKDAFASYVIDDETVESWTMHIAMTGDEGSESQNEEDAENFNEIAAFAAALIRNEHNNQIRNISTYCSSCTSERDAFEKSCSL